MEFKSTFPFITTRPKRTVKAPVKQPSNVPLPNSGGRKSEPTFEDELQSAVKSNLTFVKPEWVANAVRYIRKLRIVNADLGGAIHDTIQLANTGHKVSFDAKVPPEQADAMRLHLKEKSKGWVNGVAGIDGHVDKLMAQILIAGALANEWVPNRDLSGLQNTVLVNPETIVAGYNKRTGKYHFYQEAQSGGDNSTLGKIKLNPLTFQYYGLHTDTENPIATPPFITAINPISTQSSMQKNIDHIVDQMGLMGFLECLIEKPDRAAQENEATYNTRLETFLKTVKTNLMGGMRDGITVGYKDDHEFNFHTPTKNIQGLADVWNINETQIAVGLKTDPAFIGVSKSKGTESGMNVVFTKMLSQLSNIQKIVSADLEFGYALELRLAGFKFRTIGVEFLPSTITDTLKQVQVLEIKQRVNVNLYVDGIISQEQYAENMGYEKPDQAEPRVEGGSSAAVAQQAGDDKKEEDSKKSDRGSRDKKKVQPKPKDANNKK